MRFMIRLIVILVVAVGLAIAGLLMLPGERIASIAQTQLSKQLGRAVTISSDTSISLYPTLGVTTGPATIGSADWAKNGPLLQTESLDIGIDVPALLTGTVRVTKLEARGPRILLERAADGRANWDFGTTQPSVTGETAQDSPVDQPSAGQGAAQSFDLSLEKAVIADASLRIIDHGAGTDQSFKDVDLSLSWPDMGGAARVTVGAAPFGERVEVETTVASVFDLIGGTQTPLTGQIMAAGATVTFEGAASSAPSAAMNITGDVPDVLAVMKAAGVDPAALGFQTGATARATLATQLTFDGTRLALRNMALTLNEDSFGGDIDVVLGETLPQITASVALDVKQSGALMRLVGQPPESFGLAPEFNPSLRTQAAIATDGANVTANLREMDVALETARIAGDADIALTGGIPTVTTKLLVDLPNVARTAQLAGQPLSRFGLSAQAAPTLKTNVSARVQGNTIRADLSGLSASLAGADVSGTVKITLANGAPDVSGQIKANVPSTAQLMSALGQAAPDLPRGFGRAIAANTGLAFKGNRLSLSDMTVSLDQNTISGNAAINLGGRVPVINANLAATDLDLSALSSGADAQPSSAPAGQGWPKDRIDASALGLINGTISVKAGSINMGTFALGRTDMTVAIDNSRAVLTFNELRAFDGGIAGELVANNRNGLSVGGKLNIKSIQLNPLLKTFAGIDKISGATNLSTNFLGSGNTVDAIMRSLSGAVSISAPAGTISGIDLEGLITQGNANASLTQFSDLKANATIESGVLRNSDLGVVTGRVDALGEGYVDLGNQTLDYLITPVAKEVGSKGKIYIPVRIKGPWSAPQIRPDLEAALNLEAERKKLEEQARQELEREKQKLREQAEAEAEKLRARAQQEAQKAEALARKKLEDAARKAAQKAAEKLRLDQAAQKKIEEQAKKALENEIGKGLRGLLGGN